MKYVIAILLAAAGILVAVWGAASVFDYRLQKTIGQLRTPGLAQEVGPRLANSALANLAKQRFLAPASANSLIELGFLFQLHAPLLGEDTLERIWEMDMMRALVRSPSQVIPLFELAMACSRGYSKVTKQGFAACDRWFQALFQRDRTYGYAHLRYADFIYTQGLVNPAFRLETAEAMCGQYGLALNLMDSTGLLTRPAKEEMFYKCLNAVASYGPSRGLKPLNFRQWRHLGLGIARKGPDFWQDNRQPVLSDLADYQATLKDYFSLAQGLAVGRNPQAGYEVMRAYLALHPSEAEGWAQLVQYLTLDVNKKEYSAQMVTNTLVEAAREADPEPAASLFMGRAACNLPDPALAEFFFGQAVSLDPDNPKTYLQMAQCKVRLGEQWKAVSLFEKALALKPDSAAIYVALGKVYASLQRYSQAVDQYQKALDLEPGDQEAKRALKSIGVHE